MLLFLTLALAKVEKTLEDEDERPVYLEGLEEFEEQSRESNTKKWEEKKKKGGSGNPSLASLNAGHLVDHNC